MFHNTTSSMVINACIILVRYVTHFIPRISVLIVCLDKEIDDGFTFLLFARGGGVAVGEQNIAGVNKGDGKVTVTLKH